MRILIKLQSQFYRTFTRPIAKTLLIAVFVYQVAYWSWVKLETDEIRAERDGWSEECLRQDELANIAFVATIETLETTIKEYDAATKAKKV